MLIIDLNQIMISTMMAQLGNHTNAIIEEGMLRHMVLNTLRANKVKFQGDFGKVVIACDNIHYWRKDAFPYYKQNRKKLYESSEIDWKELFRILGKIKAELKEVFPYKIIDVDGAEADDVIATLVRKFGTVMNTGEPILILSGDKDFAQLHVHGNVRQYDPTKKKWITHNDPEQYLKEHIFSGDSSDGVPNVLSPDDCFVTGTRQRPLTQKKLKLLLETDPNDYEPQIKRNFDRNKTLIDLANTPKEIQDKVLEEFLSQEGRRANNIMNYFMLNNLKNLTAHISEFV